MIKKGRPVTIENGYMDDGLITKKSFVEIQIISKWIKDNIRESDTVCDISSYGLKHILHHDTGIYLTNNEFKDAMLLAGYKPVDADQLNWRYNIRFYEEVIFNQNPFVEWLKSKKDIDVLSVEEKIVIEDILNDETFPVFANYKILYVYLCNKMSGLSKNMLYAFKRLWNAYKKEEGINE